MVSVNLYAATNTWGATSSLTGVAAVKVEGSNQTSAVGASGTSSISTLARQLSEAAERAAVRDTGMSRDQLAALARFLESKFLGDGYHANKIRTDAEVPDTDDPELLARRAGDQVCQQRCWVGREESEPLCGTVSRTVGSDHI
jgi:hypothetical protein